MFKSAAIILILALSSVHGFWTTCPGIPGPSAITSPACSGASCTVSRGQTAVFSSTITFTRAHAHLMTRLTVFVGGVGVVIPQTPPNDNGCNSLFINGAAAGCPTVPNQTYRYDLTLTVTDQTPASANTPVRFELLENGVPEICAQLTVNILV